MKNYAFEVMALDADFNIVSLLRYTNLQWTRKFYEAGTFSVQIPLQQYNPGFKYIYTKDRPEVGEISQINFIDNTTVNLSGYFLEEKLNRRVCYQKPSKTNITNSPDWITQSGAAEDVACAFFDAFKDIEFTQDDATLMCALGIESCVSSARGLNVEHTRDNTALGDKLHSILRPSLMSYRVNYDFAQNKAALEIVESVDCSQNNPYQNNPVIFSTRYGNLRNPNVLLSDTDYKNCYIVCTKSRNSDIIVTEAKSLRKDSDTAYRFLFVDSNENRSDYSSDEAFSAAINSVGKNELDNHRITMSFDFEATMGSYEYMTDFDIGYICSPEVAELGLSEDAVLIECAEVIKEGTWSMTMEFDR